MSTEFKLYNVKKEDLFSSKTKKEREALLYEMVLYALDYGIKPCARKYNTYPQTVRKWVNIYKKNGKEGLKYKR